MTHRHRNEREAPTSGMALRLADEITQAASATPDSGSMPCLEAECAAWVFAARRMREEVFGSGLFSEPAWDILLDVYSASARGVRVQISSLAPMSGMPSSTARRWARRLIALGLLETVKDPGDRRLTFLRLSDLGQGSMTALMGRYVEKVGPVSPATLR